MARYASSRCHQEADSVLAGSTPLPTEAFGRSPSEWVKLVSVQLGLATEAAGDLIRRLDGKEILKGLGLKDERIVVWDKKQAVAKRDRIRGRARPQVFRAFAPGYSRDRQNCGCSSDVPVGHSQRLRDVCIG